MAICMYRTERNEDPFLQFCVEGTGARCAPEVVVRTQWWAPRDIGELLAAQERPTIPVPPPVPEMTDEEARAALLATFSFEGDIDVSPEDRLALQEMADEDYE